MMDLKLLTAELKRDEGFRAKVYTCSAGKLTVGYGWNLEASEMPERIADALLSVSISNALIEATNFNWFFPLSDVRQRVILNMLMNLGYARFCGFKKMIAALEISDYDEAANQMEDSLWFKQVGDRAVRLVAMMENDCNDN